MKKALRNIHLWLSVPLGLVIAVVCFTGAMLVLEQEIVSVTHRKLLFVDDAPGRPLPLGTLMGRAVQSLPPGAKATGVSVSSDPRRAYRVNLSEPRGAAIVIDPQRCPHAAREFSEYAYPRDKKSGDVLQQYIDADNHAIDAVRYAMEPVWQHRGIDNA